MRSRALLLGLALLVGMPVGGCALVGNPCASPVTGTARYVSGSTPPPYHHEWTVRLDASSGIVTWSPGYGSPQSWSATFTPDPTRVGQACRRLRREPDREAGAGGGTLTVRWRGNGGRTTSVTTSDEQAADVVRAAVPAAAWDQARGGYETWRRTQQR